MRIALHWKIIIGLFLGALWAVFSSSMGLSNFTLRWIGPFGTVFINLLKLIAIPLVLFSIIKGISDLKDIKKLGNIGLKTLGLYVFSTVIAIIVGLSLVNIFKPGSILDEEIRITNRLAYEIWAEQTDGVEIMDGKNYLSDTKYEKLVAIAQDKIKKESSNDIEKTVSKANTRKEEGPLQILIDIIPSNIFQALSSNGLMLQIIFFALFFGITLLTIEPSKSEPVFKLIDGINEVFLKMVDIVMLAAPYFVFALMAGKISELAGDDLSKIKELLFGLSYYSLVVVIGLFIMVMVFYPTLIKLFTKNIGYFEFFKAIGKAQTLAFSTSSSAATLPVTMDCVNDNLKVKKEISSFVLPIGATVNMDGTSLYISVAVVFLAQFHLIDLSLQQQLIIVLTSTLASIGASAVPGAGLIMMIMVLQSVGLNPAWIAIILPVDRILDMCRTVVNVTGDASVAAIIASQEESSQTNRSEVK